MIATRVALDKAKNPAIVRRVTREDDIKEGQEEKKILVRGKGQSIKCHSGKESAGEEEQKKIYK